MMLGWLFLAVSVCSLLLQGVAFGRLLHSGKGGEVARGLRRTSACRVVAAFAYVALAAVSLSEPRGAGGVAVATFTAIQLMWITNGVLDVRLRRRLPPTGGGG